MCGYVIPPAQFLSIPLTSPKLAPANWRTDYVQLYILIGGIVGLAGVVSVSVILIRRSKALLEEG